jgi:hypothetical protein
MWFTDPLTLSRKMFRFAVLPSSNYLFTAGVKFVYFHLITLRHTAQSAGLLWTRDRSVAETSTLKHKHCTRDKHPCHPGGIRTRNPSKRAAAGLLLRPRSHWDRHHIKCKRQNSFNTRHDDIWGEGRCASTHF